MLYVFCFVYQFPLTYYNFQTEQRVYEWRAAFGSTALAMVNNFFDSDKEGRYDTDERRQEYASAALHGYAFIYSKAEGDDPSVSGVIYFCSKTNGPLEIPRDVPVRFCPASICRALLHYSRCKAFSEHGGQRYGAEVRSRTFGYRCELYCHIPAHKIDGISD